MPVSGIGSVDGIVRVDRGGGIESTFYVSSQTNRLHELRDEHGFGHHGTGADGTGEPGDGRQQMQKQDGQIAHRTILPRSRDGQRMLTNFEFAMHKPVCGSQS
jgi:hypothetical protein